MFHRTLNRYLLIGAAATATLLIAGAMYGRRHLERRLHDELIRAIEAKFDGRVELGALQLTVARDVRIQGRHLLLRQSRTEGLPPLISVDAFSVEAGVMDVLRSPRRIRKVTVAGLAITIPPRRSETGAGKNPDRPSPSDPQSRTAAARGAAALANVPRFLPETIQADGTRLVILPQQADKEPLVFELHRLRLKLGVPGAPMRYEAVLNNAKPPGRISAAGEFGPWQTADPGNTHLTGDYTFSQADLSVFKGIGGTLSSTGGFRGVLRRIEAWGTTDTPDFTVRTGGQAVRLQTNYQAVIDGTNGDTLLQPVTARLGESTVVCNGGVYQREGRRGKSVVLDTRMEDGRIEDLLRLVLPGTPPLVGGLSFSSTLDLPPGDRDVVEALRLRGSFGVDDAEFAMQGVQAKIDKLSLRGRGRHEETTDERIVSDLSGSFVLQDAVASFSSLSFRVPGARVSLEGDYGLTSQTLDFRGKLMMQVKISKTQKGIKSLLLKLADPFLAGETAGTELPIKITGTQQSPKFGLNFWSRKKKTK